MTLASNVVNKYSVLLPHGRKLTEGDIDALKRRVPNYTIQITDPLLDELIGQPFSLIFGDHIFEKLNKHLVKVKIMGTTVSRYETEVICKNGDRTSISINITPLFENGRITSVVSTVEDITERKRAETQLKAKEAAEAASRSKDEFIANMSHEIRTPLNAIIGFTEGITQSDSIETAKIHANTVLRESEHLLSLINEILDHAKIEAERIDIEHRLVDLSKLLESTVSAANGYAKEKGLQLYVSADDGVSQFIRSDPVRLRQILANLVSNAVKFTEEGTVTIKVESFKIDEYHDNLRFSVVDTGIGIAEDRQAAIFERFTQADGSTTRKFGGTGLGTTISKKLVELMDGQIGMESKLGKGSTFWFTIPFDSREAPSEDEQLALMIESNDYEPENLQQGYILVAEDYEPNQDVAKMHLGDARHTVDVAENGKVAVAMCEKHRYDLVFMDVQMPEMDGLTATRCIRSGKSPCRDIPIIGLTANAEGNTKQRCLDAGMNDVITKPIRRKQLCNVVNKWLDATDAELQTSADVDPSDDTEDSAKQTDDAPLDIEQAVDEFGGKRELVNTLIDKFLSKADEQIRILNEAKEKQDNETVRKEAHKIRGSAATLMAMPLALSAENLEKVAQSGMLDEIAEQLAILENEFDRLKQFVL